MQSLVYFENDQEGQDDGTERGVFTEVSILQL